MLRVHEERENKTLSETANVSLIKQRESYEQKIIT